MKKLLLFLTFGVLSNISLAQNNVIREVVELQNDLTARIKNVEDDNGNNCALVRVNVPSVKDVVFETSIVGEPVCLPGEYNIYVSEKTKNLTIIVDDIKYIVDFSKYDICLEGKKCYRVVFTKESPNKESLSNTVINANYDNAVVMIDGVPVGQTPVSLENISFGPHTLSVPNTFGVTMNDTIINFAKENSITLNLHKEKRKPVYVDMATPGGDTSSWYKVFGTNLRERSGKWGIVDYAGEIIVPFEFDGIYPSVQNGYYLVEKNSKKGLYEPGKGLIVPCIYDGITTNKSYTHDEYMPVSINLDQDKKWKQTYGVLSPTGELVIPVKYDRSPECYNDYVVLGKEMPGSGCTYGMYSYDGLPIGSTKYASLGGFHDGIALFSKFDHSEGLLDINGNETIIPSKYTICSYKLSSGLFTVKDKESEKWGYMDKNLNLVIPTIYDAYDGYWANSFLNGLVMLKLNGDEVVLNSKGDIILSKMKHGYKAISLEVNDDDDPDTHNQKSNYVHVKNDKDKWGLLNDRGEVIVPCECSNIRIFADDNTNYIVLDKENCVDVINEQQQLLFTLPSSLYIEEISNGFVLIKEEETNSYGYLNYKGEILASCIYGYNSKVEDFEENKDVSNSEESDDSSVKYDITEIIDDKPISEGFAILSIGDRFGFINNKGDIVVPLNYTAVTPFENGVAYVRNTEGKWTKIQKKDL